MALQATSCSFSPSIETVKRAARAASHSTSLLLSFHTAHEGLQVREEDNIIQPLPCNGTLYLSHCREAPASARLERLWWRQEVYKSSAA